MKHFLLIIFSILITDFYFFPIEFIFLPGINTKMVLAGISLIILGFNLARHRSGQIDKAFLWLSLSALCVSFVSYISIVVNNTPDHSFTGYIMSMWVWLGGAYTVIRTIKLVHGKVSIPIVCNYLISVCVMQCILAYIMNMYTDPEYRRLGIAYKTLDMLIRDTKSKGITAISLEATEMGRPLYEKYGFVKMNDEMELPE